MPGSLLQLSSASGATATETLCALSYRMVSSACPSAVAQSPAPRHSALSRAVPLEISQSRASIRRSLHHTRTMANRGPMGGTPPAAIALKTIRLQRLGRVHFDLNEHMGRSDSCLQPLVGIVERSRGQRVIPQPCGAEVAGQHAHCVSRLVEEEPKVLGTHWQAGGLHFPAGGPRVSHFYAARRLLDQSVSLRRPACRVCCTRTAWSPSRAGSPAILRSRMIQDA